MVKQPAAFYDRYKEGRSNS